MKPVYIIALLLIVSLIVVRCKGDVGNKENSKKVLVIYDDDTLVFEGSVEKVNLPTVAINYYPYKDSTGDIVIDFNKGINSPIRKCDWYESSYVLLDSLGWVAPDSAFVINNERYRVYDTTAWVTDVITDSLLRRIKYFDLVVPPDVGDTCEFIAYKTIKGLWYVGDTKKAMEILSQFKQKQ